MASHQPYPDGIRAVRLAVDLKGQGMSRRQAIRLSPSWLPLIRDRLTRAQLKWVAQTGYAGTDSEEECLALGFAPLYWVTRDMTLLACHTSGEDIPATMPPSPSGFIAFSGGIKVKVEAPGVNETRSIDAIQWTGGSIRLYTTDRVPAPFHMPPLSLDPRPGLTDNAGMDVVVAYVNRVLAATFALMREERIVQVSDAEPSALDRVPAKYAPTGPNLVRIVDVRENLDRPDGRAAGGRQRERREYSHRFIVNGFWRNQAYGPNHSLRRRQWIPPFIKGPKNKPLIVKDTVRVIHV